MGAMFVIADLSFSPGMEVDVRSSTVAAAIEEILDRHHRLTSSWRSPSQVGRTPERRREPRSPARIPVLIRPAGFEEGRLTAEPEDPVIAVTRDLSPRGIALRCDHPVTAAFVVAEFDGLGEAPCRLLLEIRWRRRTAPYSYLIGTRAVGLVDEEFLAE